MFRTISPIEIDYKTNKKSMHLQRYGFNFNSSFFALHFSFLRGSAFQYTYDRE